jgi:hypothetical protein
VEGLLGQDFDAENDYSEAATSGSLQVTGDDDDDDDEDRNGS